MASVPHTPAAPWTAKAPIGSSIFSLRSTKPTTPTTISPAMNPVTMAAQGSIVAQPAVMPTRPPSAPLPAIGTSGRPVRSQFSAVAPMVPAHAASTVLSATNITISSAASSEPALKPNQPNHRMNTPRMASVTLWPGMVRDVPSAAYLPMRGPSIQAPTRAIQPPTLWTMVEPAKSLKTASPIEMSAMRPPPQVQWTTIG